jgi:hypothetical protein
VTINATGGGGTNYWDQTTAGINTLSNVGIGTTNPQYTLDVGGDINSSSSISATYSLYFLNGSGSLGSAYDESMLQLADKDLYINANDIIFTSYNNGGTESGELMRLVTTSGNLGIGTTNPTSKLTVTGNVLVSGVSTFSNQLISTGIGTITTGGGQIYLNGATSNRIEFNTNGSGAPTFVTRSEGTKIVLYPGFGPTKVDYGFGIDGLDLWSSVSAESGSFKWYAATTNIATLFGTGELVLGTTTKTGTASQPLQVTGGAYVSGNLGIGSTNPTSKLTVQGDALVSGIVTASSFSGSGINLTGIVTSIVAGTNVTISGSTGQVTINATGGGGGGSQTLDQTLTLGNTSSLGMSVGVVTSTSFSGSGINLTGIVTSLTAGSGISLTGETGNVTINATGGGGSTGLGLIVASSYNMFLP